MNKREFSLNGLIFREIDFISHSDLCLQFRADSFAISFGDAREFWEKDGKGGERYLTMLQSRPSNEFGAFHIWKNGSIVGQMELGLYLEDPSFGYVNLFYLAPKWRKVGLGTTLNDFVKMFLRTLGVSRAQLTVSPFNESAYRFYLKHGWTDLGKKDCTGQNCYEWQKIVHWMELNF